ncbi:MAG: 4Fe-4S dicluster domain-containing protein [Alphaproteobacteria bacterium]|nr:4Fe-4S dicluster domain-containing protein [Alphaproteobacteria bacterium]
MANIPEVETKELKRDVLVRIIKAFLSENFEQNTRLIPYDMRPKGCEVPYRCCVFKERAILRDRVIAGLGFAIEEDDEKTLLSDYAKKSLDRKEPDHEPLTVLGTACKGCQASRVYITELCQNCVARSCIKVCRFGAITHKNGRAVIDPEKCKKCGLCMSACPYGAVVKTVVPCESVCPTGAISKGEDGRAHIDMDKCISCGKCVTACPFGAVHAKSQLIDVLNQIKQGKQVVAMMAPSLVGHLPCSVEKFHAVLKNIGFKELYEVAQGADVTATHEAQDLKERLERGDAFMTTSCCAAYNELVEKHLPELKKYVSDTQTPLYYTAEIVKKEHPEVLTVFLSPCFAKRREVITNPNVDYVLNFEELAAILVAMDINMEDIKEEDFTYEASKEAKDFPLSGGVARSVAAAWKGDKDAIKPVIISGLTKESIRTLSRCAKTGKCDLGNLIEVMSCEGGCIAGNACTSPFKKASKKVEDYSSKSHSLKDKE